MVMPEVRLALAQTNPTVGAIVRNMERCLQMVQRAGQQGAEVVLFGEMAVTGYPIEDLASQRSFVLSAEEAVVEFAQKLNRSGLGHIAVVIGHPALAVEANADNHAIAQNRASVLRGGEIIGTYAKHHLPNYSVFDEYRNFLPGNKLLSFEHAGMRFASVICEDIWQAGGPVSEIANQSVDVTLILNGSPFELEKTDKRFKLASDLAKQTSTAVAYVNLVGGQDDLVFDGGSFVVDHEGRMIGRAAQFEEDLVVFDITSEGTAVCTEPLSIERKSEDWQIWNALVLGLKDYVHKNGFSSVVLGLSGGIDSAVCATIAADALGSENVFGVSLPSKYSSDHSKADASDLVTRQRIPFRTEPIADAVASLESQLQLSGLAAENLQARVRGLILMGISNAEGHLTLTTGNKTELAVGYSTIYGDSVGGFAPLKDIAKTLVWRLARYRNQQAREAGFVEPIPENSISKPPSAELRPDQTDQDTLPEYDLLDTVLDLYIGQQFSPQQIEAKGFDKQLVERIVLLVDRSEWKRRQGAIGPKISALAFGRDRRLPITNQSNSRY